MGKGGFSKPLLFKLTALAIVVTLLSVGVTTFFVVRFAQNTLEERIRLDLCSDAEIIKRTLPADLRPEDLPWPQLGGKLEELGEASDRLIRIVSDEGETLLVTKPEIYNTQPLIISKLALDHGGILEVSVEKSVLKGVYQNLIRGAIIIGLLVSFAAFALVIYLNNMITAPIKDLLSGVKLLQEREFGRKVLVRRNDEIGQLGRAFNELSETLEDLFFTISDREGKLDAILSSMDDAVVAVNMSRKVILANRAAADLFNLDSEQMIGKNQFEATKNEHLSRILEETMDTKESQSREVKMHPSSERTLAVTSSFLEDEKGNSLGAVAVMRDITSLLHLEQMRQEFVANVSHELRTPLTSIKGFVETLLNGNLTDRALLERFLGIIMSETDRMIILINDLLDLSRIESGKQPLKNEAVDLREIFDDTVLILQNKAKERQITLENNIYDKVLVKGDPKLLRQVAINLVDNGVKYTPEGGRVWIEAVQGLDTVELIISDNGLGIDSEHLDRLFERFYRVDKGRARHMGGTGLGLAITKHIIDRHKGSIAVESRKGKGTKMRITLRKMSKDEHS